MKVKGLKIAYQTTINQKKVVSIALTRGVKDKIDFKKKALLGIDRIHT